MPGRKSGATGNQFDFFFVLVPVLVLNFLIFDTEDEGDDGKAAIALPLDAPGQRFIFGA